MSTSTQVLLTETALELAVQLSDGTTGATALVAIKEAGTANSWLDFDDNTFKTSGWTTRQQAMSAITNAPGGYRFALDITALSPARVHATELIAYYDISGTGLQVYGDDRFQLVEAVENLVWDEILQGNTHNIKNSAGKRLRQLSATVFDDGTAQAGGSSTITLQAGASAIDNFYQFAKVLIDEGTGADQERMIVQYDGATKVATVTPSWATPPDATSLYQVIPGMAHAEIERKFLADNFAQSATINTITLAAAESAVDGIFDPAEIVIIEGTGFGQTRRIFDYDGTSKVAAVDRDWRILPDATSRYRIIASAGLQHVNEGLLQGATANTATLNADASSQDDIYRDQLLYIKSGPGQDQAHPIIAYNGTTKVATLVEDWHVAPDATSTYAILPFWSPIDNIDRILGLSQDNYMMDNQTYDTKGLLKTARVRIFASAGALSGASAGAVDDAENEIARYEIDVVATTPGVAEDYRFERKL